MRTAHATVAVVALSALLAGCGSSTAGTVPRVTTLDDSRWVGVGRAVVAVPEWWTTGETRCLAPVEDTVYFDTGASVDCADPVSPAQVAEVSALAVLDASQGYGEHLVGQMKPDGEVAGREVLELDGCESWFEGVCRRMFAIPSEGVVFAVTIADEGDGSYEEIRDSSRILPEGRTTVPLATTDGWTPTWGAEPRVVDALRRAVERAGLRAEVVTARPRDDYVAGAVADLPPGSLLEVNPALGAPIGVGETVSITVAVDSSPGSG